MFKVILVIISLLLSPQLMAESFRLVINGKALHEKKGNLNENNWGLGFEYEFRQKQDWITFANGGSFLDSFNNPSNYLGGGIKRRFHLSEDESSWRLELGATAFFMTRKDVNNERPFFGMLPYVSIGTELAALNITWIPPVSPKFTSLWFFQASVKVASW